MIVEFLSNNKLVLLQGGDAFFPALVREIDAAKIEVRLETYIFLADESGEFIASALIRAAQRGVAVHLTVDGFGSPHFMAALGERLRLAGVEVLIYRPEIARFRIRRHRLRRLHRKLVCIDARIAFVGGINIQNDRDIPGQVFPRLDYAVQVEGELLNPIQHTIRRLWSLLRWVNVGQRYIASPLPTVLIASEAKTEAAFVTRDNLRHRRDIETCYLDAIAAAQHEIVLANAYFLPGRRFRQALLAAAKRGVTVKLLLQGQMDYRILYHATQALYGQLLAGGIEIYEYQRSYLHAKVAVIDTCWATVGSSNIDPFSLLLAREANVVVRDSAFASELRESLNQEISAGAVRIESWGRQAGYLRLINWLAYGLIRIMIGLAGYGRQL